MIIVNNRDKIKYRKGITITDVLKEMNYTYNLITVTVNEKVISSEEYNETVLKDEDKVGVFHLAHGG